MSGNESPISCTNSADKEKKVTPNNRAAGKTVDIGQERVKRKYVKRKILPKPSNSLPSTQSSITDFVYVNKKRQRISASDASSVFPVPLSPEGIPIKRKRELSLPVDPNISLSDTSFHSATESEPSDEANMELVLERLDRMESNQNSQYQEITKLIESTSKTHETNLSKLRHDLEEHRADYKAACEDLGTKISDLDCKFNEKVSGMDNKMDHELNVMKESIKKISASHMSVSNNACLSELTKKLERLEKESKKKNLVISGLQGEGDPARQAEAFYVKSLMQEIMFWRSILFQNRLAINRL